MSKDTGGAAFPRPVVYDMHGRTASTEQDGMTLRDWFAGMALQGMALMHKPPSGIYYHDYAEDAYHYADAMLEARNK